MIYATYLRDRIDRFVPELSTMSQLNKNLQFTIQRREKLPQTLALVCACLVQLASSIILALPNCLINAYLQSQRMPAVHNLTSKSVVSTCALTPLWSIAL